MHTIREFEEYALKNGLSLEKDMFPEGPNENPYIYNNTKHAYETWVSGQAALCAKLRTLPMNEAIDKIIEITGG